MKLALRSLGLSESAVFPIIYPYQPLLIYVANSTKKGCSRYYHLLRHQANSKTNLSVREERWHQELNCTLSSNFWTRVYTMTSEIKYDNKVKWLQYQINRNSLFTNYKVSKFSNEVSAHCTFCQILASQQPKIELISHLFTQCTPVKKLWEDVSCWLDNLNVYLPLDEKTLIFGCHDQLSSAIPNSVVFHVKYYIWLMKQKEGLPEISGFLKYFKSKLFDLQNAYLHLNKLYLFNCWANICDSLSNQ